MIKTPTEIDLFAEELDPFWLTGQTHQTSFK